MLTKKIKTISRKYYDDFVKLRHQFHMYPELSFQEFKTSEIVIKQLEKLGLEVQKNIAKTGVVGILKGKKPGKTVLLRADMDALPIDEKANVKYKSKIPNVMHACGHDGHTAALLGTAMVLKDLKEYISGNVKFLFQPAEEGAGGAKPMIQEGVLDNPKVDAAFALHVDGAVPEGHIKVKNGPFMASSDDFTIKILGKGGHGASPHLCIDPIDIAIKVVDNIKNFLYRKIDPLNPYVLSFCSINGGSSFNIIPDEVIVTGTLRTLDKSLRDKILDSMEIIIKDVTRIYDAKYSFSNKNFAPPLINDVNATSIVIQSASKILGQDKVLKEAKPSMGSEDFAFFANHVPSSMFLVGIKKDEEIIAHNPYFVWDDKNLLTAVSCLSQITIDFLNKDEEEIS